MVLGWSTLAPAARRALSGRFRGGWLAAEDLGFSGSGSSSSSSSSSRSSSSSSSSRRRSSISRRSSRWNSRGGSTRLYNTGAVSESGSHTAALIDGKSIAADIRREIKRDVSELHAAYGVTPGLAVILVGARKDSAAYVRSKQRACTEVGIESAQYNYLVDATEEDVLAQIGAYTHAFTHAHMHAYTLLCLPVTLLHLTLTLTLTLTLLSLSLPLSLSLSLSF